jgi:predicted DsbA family dithiol-disulfide isomerase
MTLRVVLWSDFGCPFCYVAERGLVQRLEEDFDIDIEWRGFELHPEAPEEGQPVESVVHPRHLPAIQAWIREFAEEHEVPLGAFPNRMPNTRKALAMCAFAKEFGKLRDVRDGIMEAMWVRAQDIADCAVLSDVARRAGLDPRAALAACRDPRWQALVDAAREEASDLGVTGIPTFLFGRLPVIGCQPYEALARAAERAGARRQGSAEPAPLERLH